MEVYVIKHDIYGYEDGGHESFVELFDTLESATNYFEAKKESIIEEYLDHTRCDSLTELLQNDDCYHDFEATIYNLPYMFIDLDEYGHDRLVIQKKSIMSFN